MVEATKPDPNAHRAGAESPVFRLDLNEQSPHPATPPIGSSGDGADARTPEDPHGYYCTNVPQPDNTASPSKGPALYPNQGK
jgi:hypothetical protein